MSGKTYAISGIPPPANAKLKTKTIPYAPGMPFRLEITELSSSTEPVVRRQWTLFVLALERFKNMGVEERLSYFQVAGIHGYPKTGWDGASSSGFYCQHNTVSFPTWHRPYMLLFEKLLWEHMREIIKDEWKLKGDERTQWEEAADTWRLPYWDWARRQTYNMEFALPYVLTLDVVPIFPPKGQKVHPNPLAGYVNPEKYDDKTPRKFGDMPEGKTKWKIDDDDDLPWSQCSGVSRYGILWDDDKKDWSGLEGVNNFQTANVWMKNFSDHWYNPYKQDSPDRAKFQPPGTLADSVNRIFSEKYTDSWGTFSSTKWWNEGSQTVSTGYLSLEYIHNNVHNISGGNNYRAASLNDGGLGHMSDVPVAAFDPMFWIHHCNIDRLLAMWQVLNWDSWWNTTEDPNDGKNKPDTKPGDPLEPFHKIATDQPRDKDSYFTSDDVRDWTKLNYQYDDLAPKPEAILPNGDLDEEKYKRDLRVYAHSLYPSTIEFVHKLRADRSIDNEDFFGQYNAQAVQWNDYIINVVYDRYALRGRSYKIEFWLGGKRNDPDSTFSFPENLVGEVYSLGGLPPATSRGGDDEEVSDGCANCAAQMEDKVLSKAQVPLTIPIISQALDLGYGNISSTRGEDVVPYLEKHLHWKFVVVGGEEKPAEDFPDTKISVWRGLGRPQYLEETGEAVPSKYARYEVLYEPTDDKEGGLQRSDSLLGVDHQNEFSFRDF